MNVGGSEPGRKAACGTTSVQNLLIRVLDFPQSRYKNQEWNSIAVVGRFLAWSANNVFRACTEVLDVVAISRPGISIPAESVFPACCNCPQLGMCGGGLSALVPGTLPLRCCNCLDIARNHLIVSSCNGSSYPISDQDLLVLVTWTNMPSLSTSSPVDPLKEPTGKALHCRTIMKSASTVHGQAGHRVLILFGAE